MAFVDVQPNIRILEVLEHSGPRLQVDIPSDFVLFTFGPKTHAPIHLKSKCARQVSILQEKIEQKSASGSWDDFLFGRFCEVKQ